jgi:hypothetical protein
MSSIPAVPTGQLLVDWNNLAHQFAHDALGRKFKWTELKGKTIFICGHGSHYFSDGYVTVPPATSINFYQTYGRLLESRWVYRIIEEPPSWLQPERTFATGQSCPNVCLQEEDQEHFLTDTNNALKRRFQAIPETLNDAFVLNTNQFTNLPYRDWKGRPSKTLTLEDTFQKLPGNKFEWVCCQELMWKQRIQDSNETAGNSKSVRPLGFAKDIESALQAAENVRKRIRQRYN